MWVLVNKAQGIVIVFYDEGSRGRKVLTDFLLVVKKGHSPEAL